MSNWITNDKGNHIRLCDSGDNILSTVFKKRDNTWGIIDNRSGEGRLVAGGPYPVSEFAKDRADDIIDNDAKCVYVPKNTTGWKRQKKLFNGVETYGRKQDGRPLSVKRATSGKWFYSVYDSNTDPVGWFDSADEAMLACDIGWKNN